MADPAAKSDDISAEKDAPKQSWWQRLLSGPTFVAVALITALAGVAAPGMWNIVRDAFRPPVLVWVGPYGGPVGNNSSALPEVVDPAQVNPDLLRRSAPVGVHGTTVTVEGAQARQVLITNMRARILSRGPNFTGTLLNDPPQGSVSAEQIIFNLDESSPVARHPEAAHHGAPYFAEKATQLTDGELAIFKIQTRSQRFQYRWVIDIDMVVDGKPQTYTAKPEGRPFEMTGSGHQYGVTFERNGDHWQIQR